MQNTMSIFEFGGHKVLAFVYSGADDEQVKTLDITLHAPKSLSTTKKVTHDVEAPFPITGDVLFDQESDLCVAEAHLTTDDGESITLELNADGRSAIAFTRTPEAATLTWALEALPGPTAALSGPQANVRPVTPTPSATVSPAPVQPQTAGT